MVTSITAFAAPKPMADGAVFDAEYYAMNHPDVVSALGNEEVVLYHHYGLCGSKEGRLPYELTPQELKNIGKRRIPRKKCHCRRFGISEGYYYFVACSELLRFAILLCAVITLVIKLTQKSSALS